jgi:hypothetical protein
MVLQFVATNDMSQLMTHAGCDKLEDKAFSGRTPEQSGYGDPGSPPHRDYRVSP